MQPKNWGISLGAIDLTFVRESGRWRLTAKRSRLIPVTRDTPADPEVLALARPYHEVTERFLEMPVAESPAALDGTLGRIQDSALLDAVQIVQLHYTKADVSMTALFNPRVSIPLGPVSVRQIAALYIYDNELYLVEGNGRMLREALENAARYFLSCRDEACTGPLVNKDVMGFNFDIAQGVEYEIDLTRPEGSRVRGLRFRGRPLADAQPLRIAINNYRAGGSGGYTMFRNAKVLWRSNEEIRDMIVRYYTEKKRLPDAADHNWRIVPEAARSSLEREIRAASARPSARAAAPAVRQSLVWHGSGCCWPPGRSSRPTTTSSSATPAWWTARAIPGSALMWR
jgi:2',3'-cyclic-nucleotide 2'-phosphodiesterase/3'-nucleotidase